MKTCIVKKRLWHYKLIMKYSPMMPSRGLCGYVWQVVLWSAGLIVSIPTGLAAVVMGPLVVVFGDTVRDWMSSLPFTIELWLYVSAVIGVMAWGMGLVAGAIFVIIAIGQHVMLPVLQKAHDSYYGEDRRLLSVWWQAKKDKLCPIIQYED